MLVQDLGQLDGTVLVFGGAYSNLAATRSLFAEARALGVSPDHVICTGDTVAYCAEPVETVSKIRKSGCHVLAGNCEKQLAAGGPDCGCGFEAGTTCDILAAGWFDYANRMIGTDERNWMESLPDMMLFHHHENRYAVVHGGVRNISQFIWPTSPQSVFEREINAINEAVGHVDVVVAGHCGFAFERRVAGVQWINAGVIGMPQNDGNPDTRFVTLSTGRAKIRRLTYDFQSTHAAMQRAGLTQGYDSALFTGLWPSEEVLPEDLRRASLAKG